LPYVTFTDNLLDTDPHLKDVVHSSFELQDDSPAFKFGFQRIPFEKIGLYPSDDRASWPVAYTVRSRPEL
jgi:hypothetical protein